MINFIIWAIVYGYFALRYDDDPEVCYASSGKDFRISDNKVNTGIAIVNVGDRFRICFQIFFFVCLLQLVMVTFMQMVGGKDGLRRGLSLLTIFAQYAFYMVWIILIIVRFNHAGKVCSGDYLSDNDSTDGYLIEQGRFVKVIFYFFLYSIAIFGCCACIAFMYSATRPTPQQR